MLYRFKSRATAPLIMLGRSGERLLKLIGKSPSTHGIIEAAAMPRAVDMLMTAIEEEEADPHPAVGDDAGDPDGATGEGVSLRQRAWPLIDMMERCHAGGDDIVWAASSNSRDESAVLDPGARSTSR